VLQEIEPKDDIKELFAKTNLINNICTWIFWINVGMALASCYLESHPYEYDVTTLQIILLVSYIGATTLNNKWLLYNAEAARRRNAVENAFQIYMSEKSVIGYYNNQISHPFQKYAVNLFESCFFSKNIVSKMRNKAVVKLFGVLIFCICAFRNIHDSRAIMLVIEVAFSAVVFSDLISILFYFDKLTKIYDNMYEHMITIKTSYDEQNVFLLYDIVEYEAVKAHYNVLLDEKIYNKYNDLLSKEWNHILEQITFEKSH